MSGDARTEWPYVECVAPADAADSLGSALVDLGANGVEQRDDEDGSVRLVAYFDAAPDLSDLAAALAETPDVAPEVARAAAGTLRAGATPDDDWLRIWKRGFAPTPVGERLLVYPSWRKDEALAIPDRVRVEVDPGMAFGTGTHETTRLCLEWLDAHWRGGSLLDVGTGTGILAIAAILLEPDSRVVGVDVDPVAVGVARENAEINAVETDVKLATAGPAEVDGEFDVVLANLTADVIVAVLEALVARTKPGGSVVLSGVLGTQSDGVVAEAGAAGLELVERRDAGEWVSLALRRP